MREVVLDFETRNPGLDLTEVGSWRYADDYGTDILCLCWCDNGLERQYQTWVPGGDLTWLMEAALDPDACFIAFNAAFEKAVWRRIMVPTYGLPDVPDHRWHDIMAVCAMKCLPMNLEDACGALNLDVEKDTAGRKHTIGLSKLHRGNLLHDADALERTVAYCVADVQAEVALHRAVGWLPPGERQVWLLDQEINQRGVRLDRAFIAAAQQVVDRSIPPLADEFRGITGGLKPTQTQKFLVWLKENGVALPNLQAETIDAFLENPDGYCIQPEQGGSAPGSANAYRACSIRRLVGSSSIKKLGRMQCCVSDDGRARGLYQYHGAGPGRWTGRLIQPQNLPRGTIDLKGVSASAKADLLVAAIMSKDPQYVELISGKPPVQTVLSSLRHSFVPDPGHLFVVGDFATIEARIVLALAGNKDKLELLRTGGPVYEDMAEAIFGYPVNKVDHPEQRQTGKNSVLGCGFGMGAEKFQTRYAKDKPLEWCQNVINTYRYKWAPEVPQLWSAMRRAAQDTIQTFLPHASHGIQFHANDDWLTMTLPSGRALWYHKPLDKPMSQKSDVNEEGGITCSRYMPNEVRSKIYGALLVENAVQAMARDLLTHAMLSCARAKLPIVMHTHDEIVIEVPKDDACPELLRHHMCDNLPDWATELNIPVAAELWVGDRYRK